MKSDWRLKHYVSADEDDNSDYCLLFINLRRNHPVTQRKQVSPIAYCHAYTLASSCLVMFAWFRLPVRTSPCPSATVRFTVWRLVDISMCEWAFGRNCTQRPG